MFNEHVVSSQQTAHNSSCVGVSVHSLSFRQILPLLSGVRRHGRGPSLRGRHCLRVSESISALDLNAIFLATTTTTTISPCGITTKTQNTHSLVVFITQLARALGARAGYAPASAPWQRKRGRRQPGGGCAVTAEPEPRPHSANSRGGAAVQLHCRWIFVYACSCLKCRCEV